MNELSYLQKQRIEWARGLQFSSVTQSCPTLCNPMNCSTPGLPVHHQLLEPAQTHVHRVSDAIQPSHPLTSPSPHAFNLSQHQGLFQWISSSHQVAKVLELRLQDQSHEYSGLISSRIDWLDLLAVQETLKCLLQHHSSKASVLRCSAFFIVQLSHPYSTTGKTMALTLWTFVSKMVSLLFNMLSRLVIAFLPRSKCLWIPWLQLPSAVILEPKKIKSVTASAFCVCWPDASLVCRLVGVGHVCASLSPEPVGFEACWLVLEVPPVVRVKNFIYMVVV